MSIFNLSFYVDFFFLSLMLLLLIFVFPYPKHYASWLFDGLLSFYPHPQTRGVLGFLGIVAAFCLLFLAISASAFSPTASTDTGIPRQCFGDFLAETKSPKLATSASESIGRRLGVTDNPKKWL